MRIIEEIKGACRIEPGDKEGSEHWVWTGAYTTSANGTHRTPMVWAMDIGKGKMRTQSVPRALLQMKTGKPIPAGKTPRQMCKEPGCVNPDCWKLMGNKEYGRWQIKTGFLATRNNYFESNRKTWDSRGRKVTSEMAKAIVADNRVGHVIAAELGLDVSTVNKYRIGMLGTRARAGMFAGLIA